MSFQNSSSTPDRHVYFEERTVEVPHKPSALPVGTDSSYVGDCKTVRVRICTIRTFKNFSKKVPLKLFVPTPLPKVTQTDVLETCEK